MTRPTASAKHDGSRADGWTRRLGAARHLRALRLRQSEPRRAIDQCANVNPARERQVRARSLPCRHGDRNSAKYARSMKGDRVEVVVAADDGSRTYEIVATRAGRRVEVSTGRGVVEVVEVTRTGEPVRTARFMASRVVALVEHPASEAKPAQPTRANSA